MGRPKGSKNKSTLAKLGLDESGKPKKDTRTDKEIVDTISERFAAYFRLVQGAASGSITSLIVSGSAGVGKTYTAHHVLNDMKEKRGIRYKVVNGSASALGIYETAWHYRHQNDVILLDDADRVFDNEESLNILKVLLDTSTERSVSWLTDNALFKGESEIPREYIYNGSMIFISNKDFQGYIDAGVGKYTEHMEALMSRAIYLDLKMHTRREVALWVKQVVTSNQILQGHPLYLSKDQEQEVLNWILQRRDDLRELSMRTVLKLGGLRNLEPMNWSRMGELTLLRKPL